MYQSLVSSFDNLMTATDAHCSLETVLPLTRPHKLKKCAVCLQKFVLPSWLF